MLGEAGCLASLQREAVGCPLVGEDVLCLPLHQPRGQPGVDLGPYRELLLEEALLLGLSLVEDLLRGLQSLLVDDSGPDLNYNQ